MPFDDKDECGLGKLTTGTKDEFRSICAWHDRMYTMKETGGQTLGRKEVDDRFLRAMLINAGDSMFKKIKAYTFYGLARLVGGAFWKWKI